MTTSTNRSWPWALALGLCLCLPAVAQDTKKANREREALRRAQQQVTQTNQALAEVQTKLQAAENQQQALAEGVRLAKAKAAAAATKNQQLETELASLKQEREQLQARLQQAATLGTELGQQVQGLKGELEQARRVAQQQSVHIGGQRQQLAACETRNSGLYNAGRALLDECQSFVTETPPLLNLQGLGGNRQVVRQNALESHRDKLEQHRALPSSETASSR